MARDDFSLYVKRILSHRAGLLCSKQYCRAPTMAGSSVAADKTVSIGVAAHITGASPGGPRYDPSLSAEGRQSLENGIWLCTNCASLIDKNGGVDFSPSVLHGWKAEAEINVQANLGKAPASQWTIVSGTIEAHGIGEITGAHLTKPTIIAPGTHISTWGIGRITGVKK